MKSGRSIRLFLVDGSPSGLLTAEIMNWTGHVLTGPRTRLAELVQRPECKRAGVYFLVGPDPDDSLRTRVYIGESDDVAQRLKQHNRPEDQGGKDFWERVCLVTSKDQNLTKAHAKYLESKLISIAAVAGRCVLANGTAHDYVALPESDQADMAYFLEQIRLVLPVLSFDFLRESPRPSQAPTSDTASSSGTAPVPAAATTASPRFVLESSKFALKATAQEIDGLFVVLKGSRTRGQWGSTPHSYQNLFNRLVTDGILQADGTDHRVFRDDYAFDSPSAAAAVIYGRQANGRVSWLVEGSNESYAAWQDRQLAGTGATEGSDDHA